MMSGLTPAAVGLLMVGLAVVAVFLPAAPVNLLVNGSFEEGLDPGGWRPLDEGSTDIPGWVVTRGQIDHVGTFFPAAVGARSLDLHGTPGFGGVRQTFRTVPGRVYRVTFALAGNPFGQAVVKHLGVRAAGQEASFRFDTTGKGAANMGWERVAWEFRADGRETTLEFYTLSAEDPVAGPALDDVAVVAVGRGRR
jgi:choice-of-anchor C domain-containing protein